MIDLCGATAYTLSHFVVFDILPNMNNIQWGIATYSTLQNSPTFCIIFFKFPHSIKSFPNFPDQSQNSLTFPWLGKNSFFFFKMFFHDHGNLGITQTICV